MQDFYDLLGVPRDVDAEGIKKAYRKLALKHHPDRNEGSKQAEARFREVTEAYEVLRDPEKRATYDRYGPDGLKQGASGGFGGFDFSEAVEIFMRDFGGFGNFEEILRSQGGRGSARGPRRAPKGQSLRVRLPLTLGEVATGVTKRLRISLLDPCDSCQGSGVEGGGDPELCGTCGGSGEERIIQRSMLGQFMSVAPCRTCGGEGVRIEDPCKQCKGDGRRRVEKDIEVEVPAGVTSENYLTLRREGNAGQRGGERGDVIVLLDVEEHETLVRDGDDLRCEVVLTVAQAALGTETEVPTLEGPEMLTVPAGIQSGEVLRLRDRGIPRLGGRGRGSQLVRVIVWVPRELTSEQEAAYETLRSVEDPPPNQRDENDKGLWSRIREAFVGR